MYPRGGQTGGVGGISSTNTGVMAQSSGPANSTTKTGSDYSGGYGTSYGEFLHFLRTWNSHHVNFVAII